MIQTRITHFRITGHGFLLKILLRDIKSVSVNKTSVPKITSQPTNFATNSIQSSDHFSGQNGPTFSACKIVNFCPSISNFGIVHFKRYILQLCKNKFGFICTLTLIIDNFMLHTVTSITALFMRIEILITFNMICICESLLTSEGFTCYNLHSPFPLIGQLTCFPYQLTL